MADAMKGARTPFTGDHQVYFGSNLRAGVWYSFWVRGRGERWKIHPTPEALPEASYKYILWGGFSFRYIYTNPKTLNPKPYKP